jgi:hypothetical protein
MIAFVICAVFAVSEESTPNAAVAQPQLRAELLQRTKVDQEARRALVNWNKEHGDEDLNPDHLKAYERLVKALEKIDKENTKWLKDAVAKHGWPTITLVGKDGAQAAWLLVQHADAAPKFQRKCLSLMTRLQKHEVSQTNLAYLTDRVLLAEGKKQRYGTQFTLTDGKWTPRPLEDEANVDKRRAELGLPPLADYARQLEKAYGPGPEK